MKTTYKNGVYTAWTDIPKNLSMQVSYMQSLQARRDCLTDFRERLLEQVAELTDELDNTTATLLEQQALVRSFLMHVPDEERAGVMEELSLEEEDLHE